jgi:hypothetical protein
VFELKAIVSDEYGGREHGLLLAACLQVQAMKPVTPEEREQRRPTPPDGCAPIAA